MTKSIYDLNVESIKSQNHYITAIGAPPDYAYHFEIIPTKIPNSPTVAVTFRGSRITLHSTHDPIKEAENIVGSKKFEHVENLVIFGFGLAYHAEAALRLLPSLKKLYIIEPIPPVFHQSLITRDLTALLSDPNIQIISGHYQQIKHVIIRLINELSDSSPESSRVLILPSELKLLPDDAAEIRNILEHLRLAERKTPVFEKERRANIKDNESAVQTAAGVATLFNRFSGMPVIVIASGPSLDFALTDLRRIKNSVPAICVDSALPSLKSAGIAPDFVISADPQKHTADLFDPSHVEGEILIFFPSSNPEVVNRFSPQKRLVSFSTVAELERASEGDEAKGSLFLSGSVFLAALDLAVRMGADPVILAGADFSILPDHTHAAGVRADNLGKARLGRLKDVRGINGSPVQTTEILYLFLRDTENYIASLRGKPKIINASARGAFITGAECMPLHKLFP
ncbi:MAG: 6-hydroxymethylpterin diphosphokinase MptE-like protein [bacterium]